MGNVLFGANSFLLIYSPQLACGAEHNMVLNGEFLAWLLLSDNRMK